MVQSDDTQRLAFLESEQGTQIMAAVGIRYPGGMSRVDYCVDGKAALVETTDRAGAFRRAAADILGMLDGRAPRFSVEDLLEASRLVEMFAEGPLTL